MGMSEMLLGEKLVITEVPEIRDVLRGEQFPALIEVPVSLEEGALEAIQSFEIERAGDIDIYAPVEQDISDVVRSFLASIGENDPQNIKLVEDTVSAIAVQVTKMLRKEAYWLALRVTKPLQYDTSYTMPRWHSDGAYFETEEGEVVYKFVFTPRGDSTLFGETEDRDRFEEIQSNLYDEPGRPDPVMTEELVSLVSAVPAPTEQRGVLFQVGDGGVIHSEPVVTEPRIFISVLPGTMSQIQEWKQLQA